MSLAAVSDTYNWVGTVGGILGIVGLVGAAVAVLRSSIATNTIKLLQQNNTALHEQNSRQQAEITTLHARIEKQDEQIVLLKEMVSGRKMLEELSHKVDRVLVALQGAANG